MGLPNVSAKQPLCVVDFCNRPFPHIQREAACKGRVRMAPKGAKWKFEPTEWTDIDVSGLLVQWKVTAAGDGSLQVGGLVEADADLDQGRGCAGCSSARESSSQG